MAGTELLTEEDRIRLFANALADERDHAPVVKLFTPDALSLQEVDPAIDCLADRRPRDRRARASRGRRRT